MATVDARFSAAHLPEVNTWVRMASAQSSRRWVNAVPALVSQVSTVLVPGASKSEVRVNVLAPNVLALRHNFQAEAYREFQDLPLADVRPYVGHDQKKLQSLLLAAVRNKARLTAANGKAMAPPPSRTPSKRTLHREVSAPPLPQVPSPSKRKLVDEEMDTTRENVAKFFKRCAREKPAQEEAQVAETQVDGSQVGCQVAVGPESAGADAPPASEGEAEVHSHAATSGCELEEVQPTTPQAHPGRTLVYNVTPLEPELPRLRGTDDSAASAEKVQADLKAEVFPPTQCDSSDTAVPQAPMPTAVALSKERLSELTRLTSRAFRKDPGAESEGILSKRAIADMMEEAGANLVPGELDEALKHLDAANKIVLTDELVFMV